MLIRLGRFSKGGGRFFILLPNLIFLPQGSSASICGSGSISPPKWPTTRATVGPRTLFPTEDRTPLSPPDAVLSLSKKKPTADHVSRKLHLCTPEFHNLVHVETVTLF